MKSRLIIALLLLITFSQLADAQTRRRSKERKKEKTEEEKENQSLGQRLAYDIRIGSPSFGGGFSMSLKPSIGYKWHKRVTTGIGGRGIYTLINYFQAPDVHYFDYGGFLFGRIKIGDNFYVQGEYNSMSFDLDAIRYNVSYPAAGVGYLSGLGDWSYGVELMFPLSEEARDYGPSFEYLLNISYRF